MCRSNTRGARLFRCVGASFPHSQERFGQEGLTMGGPPTGLSRRTEDLPARPSGNHEVGPARPGERNTSFHPEFRVTTGQQGLLMLPSFFISMVWKGLLPALAGNECRTNRHHNKYQHVGGRKGMVVGQNQNAKPQGNGTGARKRFQRSRSFL